MALVLLVEDEANFSSLVRKSLEAEGHSVLQAFTGPDGLTLAEQNRLDLVILDGMLPGMDGLTVCRMLRNSYLVPILMLTARSEEIDRVLGLEVGADEYLVKPVSLRELMARVRAMLRRVEMDMQAARNERVKVSSVATGPETPANSQIMEQTEPAIEFGDFRLVPSERQAFIGDEELDLTPKEYELLKLMSANPGRAFSRDFLLEHIWGYEYDGFDRTVDTHILRLRKKLGPLGDRISTVWGVGYRFAREA